MPDTNVRRDKKFWVSLELHREIERIMILDPKLVRGRGSWYATTKGFSVVARVIFVCSSGARSSTIRRLR